MERYNVDCFFFIKEQIKLFINFRFFQWHFVLIKIQFMN